MILVRFGRETSAEAEFLDVIGTKVLRVFLLAIHSQLYYGFYGLRIELRNLESFHPLQNEQFIQYDRYMPTLLSYM
jgi:hypothetical protein